MARQQKQIHKCHMCGALLKRTIGAASRKKFWQCTNPKCGVRRPVRVQET